MHERGAQGHSVCSERVSTRRENSGLVALTWSRLSDINKSCLEEFRAHWNCLENNNHQFFQCRRPERVLNRCVFNKLVRSHQQVHILLLTLYRGSKRPFQTHPRDRHQSTSETTRSWQIRGACYEVERRMSAFSRTAQSRARSTQQTLRIPRPSL